MSYRGEVYCKTHFVSLFKRRGTYDFKDGNNGPAFGAGKKNSNASQSSFLSANDAIASTSEQDAKVADIDENHDDADGGKEAEHTATPSHSHQRSSVAQAVAAMNLEDGANSGGGKTDKSPSDSPTKAKKKFSAAPAVKCLKCTKTVYPLEALNVENGTFHKRCFRCQHCQNVCSLGNFAMYQ